MRKMKTKTTTKTTAQGPYHHVSRRGKTFMCKTSCQKDSSSQQTDWKQDTLLSFLRRAWVTAAGFETSLPTPKEFNNCIMLLYSSPLRLVTGCDTKSWVSKVTAMREKSWPGSFPCHHSSFSTHLNHSLRGRQDLKMITGTGPARASSSFLSC